MKRCITLLILFYTGLSLYAQSYRDATIYLPPVTGTGRGPGDNEYIANQLIEHLENLTYLPVRSTRNAAFTLTATIAPKDPENESADDYPIYQAQTYVLSMELTDNRTGRTVVRQNLFYSDLEEIANILVLNFNLVPYASALFEEKPPPEPIDPDEWRKKPWYLSAGIFWTPRVYEGDYESTYYVNFGYGLWAEFHFLQFMRENLEIFYYLAVCSGLELVPDWVAVREGETYRDLLLEIPLLVSFAFKPSGYFLLMPYLGINFNIPMYMDTKPPPVAWRVGFQYGIKVGPGTLVIDPWFSMDFGKAKIASNPDMQYWRYMMHIGVKYKYGFDNFKNFFWFKR